MSASTASIPGKPDRTAARVRHVAGETGSYTRVDLKQSRATQARVGCVLRPVPPDLVTPTSHQLITWFLVQILDRILPSILLILDRLWEVSLLTRDSSKFPKPMDKKITYRNSQQIGIDSTERKLFQLRKRRNFLQSFT